MDSAVRRQRRMQERPPATETTTDLFGHMTQTSPSSVLVNGRRMFRTSRPYYDPSYSKNSVRDLLVTLGLWGSFRRVPGTGRRSGHTPGGTGTSPWRGRGGGSSTRSSTISESWCPTSPRCVVIIIIIIAADHQMLIKMGQMDKASKVVDAIKYIQELQEEERLLMEEQEVAMAYRRLLGRPGRRGGLKGGHPATDEPFAEAMEVKVREFGILLG